MLDTKRHRVGVELTNELKKSISIGQVAKLFDKLLSSLNREGQTYEVTVVPSEDALDRILGIDRLDSVLIVLKRPNPGDHHEKDAEKILRELHEQNVKEERHKFLRQSGTDGIHLNGDNLVRAEVASVNGYVDGAGLENEVHVHRSTKEYPKIITRAVSQGVTFLRALRDEMKR